MHNRSPSELEEEGVLISLPGASASEAQELSPDAEVEASSGEENQDRRVVVYNPEVKPEKLLIINYPEERKSQYDLEKEYKTIIEHYKQQLDFIILENNELKAKLSHQSQEVFQAKTNLQAQEEIKKLLSDQIADLKEQMVELSKSKVNEKLATETKAMLNTLKQKSTTQEVRQLQQLQSITKALSNEKELKDTNEKLTAEIDGVRNLMLQKQQITVELTAKIQKLKKNYKEKLTSLEETNKSLEEEKQQLIAARTTDLEIMNQLRSDLATSEKRINLLRPKITSLETEIQRLQLEQKKPAIQPHSQWKKPLQSADKTSMSGTVDLVLENQTLKRENEQLKQKLASVEKSVEVKNNPPKFESSALSAICAFFSAPEEGSSSEKIGGGPKASDIGRENRTCRNS